MDLGFAEWIWGLQGALGFRHVFRVSNSTGLRQEVLRGSLGTCGEVTPTPVLSPRCSLMSSRFSPHVVPPPTHGLHPSGIPHPTIVSPIVKQEPSQPSTSPAGSS